MKFSLLLLLLSSLALGQTPEKMITFDRANTEHCKVGVAGGKPLLESTYEGTTVAIGMPMNRGNGEFAVFVVVSRVDPGAIKVNPKDFYGLFSDPSHSRFTFVDKAAELQWQAGPQPPSSGNPNGNAQANVEALAASIAGPPPGGGGPPSGGPGNSGPPGSPPSASKGGASGPAPPALYFHGGKVQQGGKIFGWVTFRPAKGAKLDVHPTDMLSEIDIPVNGVVYRF